MLIFIFREIIYKLNVVIEVRGNKVLDYVVVVVRGGRNREMRVVIDGVLIRFID